jgi:hypothetical protein
MRFPYSLNIVPSIETGDEIVLLRPEIPLRMHGPAGIADVVALVDTGADTSIVPLSIADDLGIATTPGAGPGAIAFGGQSIRLSFAEVVLELSQDQQTIRWRARMYFAERLDQPDGTIHDARVDVRGRLSLAAYAKVGSDGRCSAPHR